MDQSVRKEIAAAAARWVADGGLDYGSAKTRAVREVTGQSKAPRGSLPDNEEIDEALLEHLSLFDPEHGPRVDAMRRHAATIMDELQAFMPLVTGAVWKGIAPEHAPIHLQLFCDNSKEVQFFLLNKGIEFESVDATHFRNRDEVEAFACLWQDQPVLLSVYGSDEQRGALRAGAASDGSAVRGDRRALLARMAAEGPRAGDPMLPSAGS